MFEPIFLRIFAIPLRFLAQTGRNMIQWASGIAGRCAVRPKQRNSAAPNKWRGDGEDQRTNRRLRAAGIAALAWAGLAAVWCVLVPGGAAELPQGVPGTLRSLLVLPLAEELVFRGALLRLLRPLGEHPANLCQAVLFAALHGTLTEKCYALGMGLIFGWAAEQTDSPAPGVVLHILNNGLVLARALAEGEWDDRL